MKYSNNAIELIILFEKTKNLKKTNYWARFKETTLDNPTDITDKAMFWFFYKIKEITIEGDLNSLIKVKAKTSNDLIKWTKSINCLDLIKNSKLNLFIPSQLQYLIHLVCEIVNSIGDIDSKYLDYMFCDNLKKTPLTFWSYNPDFPLIMNKMILIVSFTSKEKDIVTKEYGKIKDILEKYNITEERIKLFDADWQKEKGQFYGDLYGSVIETDSSDDVMKPFNQNTANLKTFLKKNYEKLQNKIQNITDERFISMMNKIYDHNFDYSILTPDDIKYIHGKQQEIFATTQDTVDITNTSNIVDFYAELKTTTDDLESYEIITGCSGVAAVISGVILTAIMIHYYTAASASGVVGSAIFLTPEVSMIPFIGGIICAGILIMASLIFVVYFFVKTFTKKEVTFISHLNLLAEYESARKRAFEDKDLDSLMMREIALFSAFNKDTEAHEINIPSSIQSGDLLDEILYHGKPVIREDLYKQIKLILS